MTATQTGVDLCAVFNAAEARAVELLGHDLIYDCVDAETGEIIPIIIVTDNGPAMKSSTVARRFNARSYFTHVRTRNRSPHTNGVIERWFESLKYERLYLSRNRHRPRPHRPRRKLPHRIQRDPTPRNPQLRTPLDRYLQTPNTQKPKT